MSADYQFVEQITGLVQPGDTKIPLVGLGTWKSKPGEVETAVEAALRAGYRHIDCAHCYQNEAEVGAAFTKVFAEGVVKREQVWVTSKLWNDSHAADAVEPACRLTLQRLKLDYLDLYLMHWPYTGNKGPTVEPPIKETWQAMEDLVRKGLVRHIGVSNFSIKKLQDLLSYATIKPAANQVEAHPYWRNDKLFDFCNDQGIHFTAYSPLGSPDSAAMLRREPGPTPLKDETVVAIAEKLGKTPGQILIRWAVQRGGSVVPKSITPSRIKENLDVYSWSIPDEDFKVLSSLIYQKRQLDGSFWVNPEGPYKTTAELWDE